MKKIILAILILSILGCKAAPPLSAYNSPEYINYRNNYIWKYGILAAKGIEPETILGSLKPPLLNEPYKNSTLIDAYLFFKKTEGREPFSFKVNPRDFYYPMLGQPSSYHIWSSFGTQDYFMDRMGSSWHIWSPRDNTSLWMDGY